MVPAKDMLAEHPLFTGLKQEYMQALADSAKEICFNADEYIFQQGGAADQFFVIRHGTVAIETYALERGSIAIQTLSGGDVVGWSWLLAPYHWHFDARAIDVTHAVSMDAKKLRSMCEEDPALGYEISKRFLKVMVQRLVATRLQLLDVYGVHIHGGHSEGRWSA